MKNENRPTTLTMGILAHVDAGKTTLSEAILFLTGAIRKMGRVDHRDAFLDNIQVERARGITVFSKEARFVLGEKDGDLKEVTLLDTPGHADFSAEMERTLQVLDYAVLVVSGTDGVQAHTRTLWKLLAGCGTPVFVFVNKMDRPGTDRETIMRELAKELGDGFVESAEDGTLNEDEAAMAGVCDPGVQSVTAIYRRLKSAGSKTQIMGASFRNKGEILALAGCDLLTISPKLLDSLEAEIRSVPQMLSVEALEQTGPVVIAEHDFRYALNESEVASDKLPGGIRSFVADTKKLEALLA